MLQKINVKQIFYTFSKDISVAVIFSVNATSLIIKTIKSRTNSADE